MYAIPRNIHYYNAGLYSMVESVKMQFSPCRAVLSTILKYSETQPKNLKECYVTRSAVAALEMIERLTRDFPKPEWGIQSTKIGDQKVKISIKTIASLPFCNLTHFKKEDNINQPKLLIVAPISGHYATLLRGTVEGMLPHFDVYITEWINSKDIPVSEGKFDLDDYINYVINFIKHLGPHAHVMAVCQPCVPVMAAVAIMSSDEHPATPDSMIMIGGPIDIRESKTFINNYAEARNLQWFKDNVITAVPFNHAGFMRYVYPGFVQLSGFLAMNPQRHFEEHAKLFRHLIDGDEDEEEITTKFYDEYMAVMDIPAEFYLQTIETVFQKCSLPKGEMVSYGRPVDLKAIRRTALLVIEGELDDITGIGQTKAAIKLCSNIPNYKKHYHLQKSVGHYGQFNGSKFREHLVPLIRKFCYQHDHHKG